jgi:hypothetical protein
MVTTRGSIPSAYDPKLGPVQKKKTKKQVNKDKSKLQNMKSKKK